MYGTLRIPISQLEKGMVLAEEIRHEPSGVVLLATGTKIDHRALNALSLFPTAVECLIYNPEQLQERPAAVKQTLPESPLRKITEQPSATPGQKDHGKSLELPAEISQQARMIYTSSYEAVKNFYEQVQLNNTINLGQVKKAAQEIASEVVRDPQVLLQVAVLKAVDNYTFSHALHVSIYATTLGRFLRFPERDLQQISMAGLLHDIGKIDVPLEILNKPGKLNNEEYRIIKEHVRHSFKRVYRLDSISRDLLSAIMQHHERIDGSGYLQKLKGDEIHKWARILAIADVYDAVTTNRVYRNAMLPHEGAEVLMGSMGELDPFYLKLFIRQISFYPVGCRVILSTGEEGSVIANNPELPLRPIVQVVDKKSGEARAIDLLENLTIFITSIIS